MISGASDALTGVRNALNRFDQTAARIAHAAGDPAEMASAIVELKNAENSVKANTTVLKTVDEMIGVLLDRLA